MNLYDQILAINFLILFLTSYFIFRFSDMIQALIRQQGEFESLHRDMMIGFGTWEFDPTDLKNPFSESEGSVHLWQGDDDYIVPVTPQRYIAHRLPWIQYHELSGAGHLFPYADGMADSIIQALVAWNEGHSWVSSYTRFMYPNLFLLIIEV